MIEREIFYEFYKKNISSNIEEINQEYMSFSKHWNEFMDCYLYKESSPHGESEYVQLVYLYAIIWGDFSLAAIMRRTEATNILFGVLGTTISNDLLAVASLALDGLDYQAMNILRNLYEVGLLTLNVCLDDEKRENFIESARKENSYEVWRKFFSTRSMLETVSAYTQNQDLSDFWMYDYKGYYRRLSSFAHNSFANLYVFNYSKPNNSTNGHTFNASGHFATRYNSILEEAVEISWFMTKVFRYFIEDNKYQEMVNQIWGDDDVDFMRHAKNGCYLANYYYLKLGGLDINGQKI